MSNYTNSTWKAYLYDKIISTNDNSEDPRNKTVGAIIGTNECEKTRSAANERTHDTNEEPKREDDVVDAPIFSKDFFEPFPWFLFYDRETGIKFGPSAQEQQHVLRIACQMGDIALLT